MRHECAGCFFAFGFVLSSLGLIPSLFCFHLRTCAVVASISSSLHSLSSSLHHYTSRSTHFPFAPFPSLYNHFLDLVSSLSFLFPCSHLLCFTRAFLAFLSFITPQRNHLFCVYLSFFLSPFIHYFNADTSFPTANSV